MSGDSPRLRLGILGVVAVSLFAALFARLYFLQVLAGPEYQVAAESNRVRQVDTPAPRGRILDAQGRVLVDNRSMVVVTVDRTKLGELGEAERADVLARLAAVIGVPVEEIEGRLADQRNSPYSPVPVAEDVSDDVFVHLREHRDEFPSVSVEETAVRTYPHGPLAAHVLGYVGEINDRELAELRDQGYGLGDDVGKNGVERVHEADLRGEQGIVELEVDAHGRVLRELGRETPVQGDDVRLTLDLDVQRVAEDALRQGLEAARQRQFADDDTYLRAGAGAVVVLDVTDGSVVAMASYPTYDPSAFVNGISTEAYAQLTDPANGTPFHNRAIAGEYAPGSTFKLISAMAGRHAGVVAPATTIDDRGVFRVEDCRGKCLFRNAGSVRFGPVDVTRALAVSSDVYFYSLGHDFWTARSRFGETGLQDVARAYGLGQPTGVPLPAEQDGRVPTPELKREMHEQRPDVFVESRWFVGDNINLAIGQGELLTTPLQLANAYATFANGGTRWTPRVAAAVQERDGSVVREVPPVPIGAVPMAPEHHAAVLQGLDRVVSDPRGTASAGFTGFPLDVWPVAGKTGTAQVTGKQDSALFVAFGPTPSPRYAVAVVMEEAGWGAEAAVPVARAVLERLAGVAPEPPPGEDAPGAPPAEGATHPPSGPSAAGAAATAPAAEDEEDA